MPSSPTPIQRADLKIHLAEIEVLLLKLIEQRRNEISTLKAEFPDITDVLNEEAEMLDEYERNIEGDKV